MIKNILAIMLITILLLTFTFGYVSDGNITNENNFIIDVESMNQWSGSLINNFNIYNEDVKNKSMEQFAKVVKYIDSIGEEFANIELSKILDIFNRDNILSFIKGVVKIMLAPIVVVYSFSMLMFNISYYTCKLIVNLITSCVGIGRIL